MGAPIDSNISISKIVFTCQRGLSIAQAVPIVGPLVVSPVKLVASIVHTLAAALFAAFFAGVSLLTKGVNLAFHSERLENVSEKLGKVAHSCKEQINSGFASGAYSCVNIISLGFAGLVIEFFEIGPSTVRQF